MFVVIENWCWEKKNWNCDPGKLTFSKIRIEQAQGLKNPEFRTSAVWRWEILLVSEDISRPAGSFRGLLALRNSVHRHSAEIMLFFRFGQFGVDCKTGFCNQQYSSSKTGRVSAAVFILERYSIVWQVCVQFCMILCAVATAALLKSTRRVALFLVSLCLRFSFPWMLFPILN